MGLRKLQLTESGFRRYEILEALSAEELGPGRVREYQALQRIVVKHPLDYVFKGSGSEERYREPTQIDFDRLVRKGYAIFVEDTYVRMEDLLKEHDPELLGPLKVYQRVAHEEEVSESELDEALNTLEGRVREQEPWAIKNWEEKVGTPTTKSEKVLALDAAVHLAHYDPDMLRALPRKEQALIGGSILGWLDELSGEKVDRWDRWR